MNFFVNISEWNTSSCVCNCGVRRQVALSKCFTISICLTSTTPIESSKPNSISFDFVLRSTCVDRAVVARVLKGRDISHKSVSITITLLLFLDQWKNLENRSIFAKLWTWVGCLVLGRSPSVKLSCNKTELKRCNTTETKTKMLEHRRSSPPIASCPTRSRTGEHPCWLGRGTSPQSGRIHLWWESSILGHLVRCYQLGCSACLARWSFQVWVGCCARHRHIPYEQPARAPRNHCLGVNSDPATNMRWFFPAEVGTI